MFDFLSEKFAGVLTWLKNRGRLTEENIQDALGQVKTALLDADVPYDIVDAFLNEVKEGLVGQKIQTSLNPGQLLIKIVHEKLLTFLGGKTTTQMTFQIPSVVLVMGLQGSGKTTSVAKLAWWVTKEAEKRGKKRRILLASVDFYRPAAVEQLNILSKQVGVDFYEAKSTNVIEAAKEINNHFKKNLYEILFLDTSGRLHVDSNMMQELEEVNKIVSPKHKILVLDAMTGQESLKVAKAFNDSVGFDCAILSKLDSDARGGAAFAFKYALKKPISFVGSGEKNEDLEAFIPERMATRILGMGDMLTLIEKASETIEVENQEKIAKKFIDGNFTLQDFSEQLDLIDKMGSLSKITRYLPGMNQLSQEEMAKGQVEMKRFKAIIGSMTIKERVMPNILDSSRKQRIAKGAGVNVQNINQLLQRFEQSKQFVKMFRKMGKLRSFIL
ncbi:MAG: Signal recognition particle protein [candidate division TM6 bacterium GW2011_GWF2_37_49]|nr:MAG: Signal recognition particle protein [candidate division TM6 bacterium GW2011_GWF2_37_49]